VVDRLLERLLLIEREMVISAGPEADEPSQFERNILALSLPAQRILNLMGEEEDCIIDVQTVNQYVFYIEINKLKLIYCILRIVNETLKEFVQVVKLSDESQAEVFGNQLAVALEHSLLGFVGMKSAGCKNEIVKETIEVLFNELSYFNLMTSVNQYIGNFDLPR
jgi:hypothetical protein